VSVPSIWLFNWCRVVIGSSGVGGGVPQLQSVFVDFWNAILNNNVIKNGKLWSLSDDSEWIGGSKIMYVRDCYVETANMVLNSEVNSKNKRKLALILGPKGIGKTMFLNYLIVRIVENAREGERLANLSIVYYYKFKEHAQGIRFTNNGCSISDDEADYFLSDSLDLADGTLGKSLQLEVALENRNNYKRFYDRVIEQNGYIIPMYVWELDELKPICSSMLAGELEFLYAVFGGRVHNILGGILNTLSVDDEIEETALCFFGADIKNAYLTSWNKALQLIRQTISNAKGHTSTDDLVIQNSMFWVVNSSTGISGFSSTFLKFVAAKMKDKVEVSLWNELSRLLGGSGQGVLFEVLGHMTLTQNDREYTAKFLKRDKQRKRTLTPLNINFSKYPRVLIRTVEDVTSLGTERYGLPIFGNFMLVDAIIKPNIMLQFTIGERHGNAKDSANWQLLRKNLGGKFKDHKLIFVIPAENFNKFTPIGVPSDLQCYTMTWEETATNSVTGGIKRKRTKK